MLISMQITNISFRCHDSQHMSRGTSTISLYLSRDATALWNSHQSTEFAELDYRDSKILGALQNHSGVSLQLFGLQDVLDSGAKSKKAKRIVNQSSVGKIRVYANIYGPLNLFESVGIFASNAKVFLQDPEHCDRNVQYRNPHRMFSDGDNVQYTQSMNVTQSTEPEVIEILEPVDLFADLEIERDLAETEPSDTLRTPLYSYVDLD